MTGQPQPHRRTPTRTTALLVALGALLASGLVGSLVPGTAGRVAATALFLLMIGALVVMMTASRRHAMERFERNPDGQPDREQ